MLSTCRELPWGWHWGSSASVLELLHLAQAGVMGGSSFLYFSKLLLLLFPCVSCRLDNNQFKDDVMELLGSVLSGKDCQIQRLR